MIKIETDRLIIRDNIKEDLFKHHLLMSDPEVMYYIQDIQTDSLESSEENLNFSIQESLKKEGRGCYFFAITKKDNHEFIGAIGFTVLEKSSIGDRVELGYFILKDYWGQGYTTEAAQAVIAYGFNTLNLHKISTGCIYENQASEKIMIKLGFTKEAHYQKHVFHEGVWKDRVEYGLLNKMCL